VRTDAPQSRRQSKRGASEVRADMLITKTSAKKMTPSLQSDARARARLMSVADVERDAPRADRKPHARFVLNVVVAR